jgi:hypothetical protein
VAQLVNWYYATKGTKVKVINVSPHLLADVLSCETRGWLRHVKSMTSNADAIKMVAGQGFHKAMELRFDETFGTELNTNDVLGGFHDTYDNPFAKLTAEKLEQSLTPQNLDRVLRRWLEMHPTSLLPWKRVLLVEEAFVSREWQFSPYSGTGTTNSMDNIVVRLIVRPDLVVEDHNGMVRWVDTKTTSWHISDPTWRQALRLSLQTQLYSDAVAQRFGTKAVLGGWINAIELRKLPDNPTRKCTEHKVAYAECGNEHAKCEFIECMTREDRIAAAVRCARNAAINFAMVLSAEDTSIDDLQMNGIANNSCRFCFGASWCEAGRPAAALESWNDMVFSPWPVEEGKRV